MDMIGRIRRLHSRKKKSEREISRMTGPSRNTVAKGLRGEVGGPPKYRRSEQPSKLTAFHEAHRQALKADTRRPKHERRTAKALYAEIRAAGYDGGQLLWCQTVFMREPEKVAEEGLDIARAFGAQAQAVQHRGLQSRPGTSEVVVMHEPSP
jgi:hypothetical protein